MPRYYVSDACSALVEKIAPYFIKFINGLALSAKWGVGRSKGVTPVHVGAPPRAKAMGYKAKAH